MEQLLPQLKAAGYKCIEERDFANALLAFRKVVELDYKDINARFVYAQLLDNGSHKTRAEARDLMLSILDEHPEIFNEATEGNLNLIRHAAVRCAQVGPFTRSIDLFRRLAQASNRAADYFQLSEILTQGDFLEESVASLERRSRSIRHCSTSRAIAKP